MGQQRKKSVEKKSSSPRNHRNNTHQGNKQKANDCTLDLIQVCANCCSPIDSPSKKPQDISSTSSQHQSSSTCSKNVGVNEVAKSRAIDDPSNTACDSDLNKMISTIYNLDFIPRLLQKYPGAISSEDTQVIIDFPLCFICTAFLKPLFSLYSQFNKIRKIESLLSRQIESLHSLINYDGQNEPLNQADDDPKENSGINSTTEDIVNSQDATTTTTSSSNSSQFEFNSTDPEPRVWVEIDPLDDLTVEEVGYVPPSLRHLYQDTSQGSTSFERRQEEIGQSTPTTCCSGSSSTKLEFSSNDRGPWVKVGSRLEDVTIEEVDPGHAPLTLPKLEQETPQSNLILSDVVSIAPAVDEDEDNFAHDDYENHNDMDDEPLISSHHHDDETCLQSDDEDVKADASDIKPVLDSDSESSKKSTKSTDDSLVAAKSSSLTARESKQKPEEEKSSVQVKRNKRKQNLQSVREEQNESSESSNTDDDDDNESKTKSRKKDKKKRSASLEKKFPCTVVINEAGQVCPFQTKDNYQLKRHISIVHAEEKDKIKCGECTLEFKSSRNFVDHFRRMHTEKGKAKYKKQLKERHEKMKARTREANAKGFVCPHCAMNFTAKINFTVHLRTVHDDYSGVKNVVSCKVCGSKFRTNCYLKRHMQTVHEDARPFGCPECGRLYKTKEKLGIHISISHNEEKRRQTSARCRARLQQKKLLRLEEARKAGTVQKDPGNVCPHCGIDFITRNKCTLHRRTVHDDYAGKSNKVVVCEVCGKKFGNTGRLTVHMQGVHSDERPFVCEECGRSYKLNSNLQTHKSRFHTEEGKQKYNEYQRENLRRKKLIREQQASKEEDEMEAETESSESDSESDRENEQVRETAVITRSSTSASSSLLPPSSY